MKRAHYLQHVSYEGPQNILTNLEAMDYSITSTKFYESEFPLPSIDDIDLLIVMGGPMGVDDVEDFSWLAEELAFIEQYVESGKKIIGVCLGAQFIAKALGAKVYKNEFKEIGWSNIDITYFDEPITQKVLHWHGDTFDIPTQCTAIATNSVTKNQGFASGNILAFQFHIEMTEPGVKEIMTNNMDEITVGGKFVSSKDAILADENYAENSALLKKFLNVFLR